MHQTYNLPKRLLLLAVTLSDDQFYQVHFINSTWLLLILLVPLEALRIFLVFNTLILHLGFFCF